MGETKPGLFRRKKVRENCHGKRGIGTSPKWSYSKRGDMEVTVAYWKNATSEERVIKRS